MLKKTITYEDLDGRPITEDFYFNLTKAELAEMELSAQGGMVEKLQSIVNSQDGAAIIATFKDILLRAYGVRSDDNKRFIKSRQLSEGFTQTDAYSVLFMELVTDADASARFIRGIVPADMAAKVPSDAPVVETVTPKAKDLREMSQEELLEFWKSRAEANKGG